ncbi:MAG: hypothetical protein K8M05_18880 [Deltaproteobacteria bacterium]|nr:hypothetical protein [Kofleriaceae bacterium]
MRTLHLLALTAALVAACGGAYREHPRWRFTAPAELEAGCVLGRSFIRMSGKTGVGVTVELRSRGDCTVRFTRAELVLDGMRAPATLPAPLTLKGRSLVYVWLPFELDNERAWNEGKRAGTFELDLEVDGAAAPTWRIAADHRRERRYKSGAEPWRPRYRSDVNAPGIVHLEAPPPRENGDPSRYVEPEDPGEHELYIGPAVVLGPATGRTSDAAHTEFEADLQVRVAYQALATSHRSKDLPFPRKAGWAMTLGWAPIQTDHAADGSREWNRGPLYLEVERYWMVFSAGLGAVAYTNEWDGGVQLTLTAMPYGLRMRYLADGGFELMGAFRIELPTAINWSR